MPSFSRICVLFLFVTLSLASAPSSTSLSDFPLPSTATKISIAGVRNAGKVSDHLYRGSQPSLNELPALKKLGVTIIIDLRAESPQTAREERSRVEALGMRFRRIPIGGFSNPTNSDLLHFFQILHESPSQTVFVHCEFGKDRTGVMIAAYRIAFEHWSSDQALSEMMQFGFNHSWHPSMITFVRNLPARFQSDAELKNAIKAD
jgi:protein tyrosine/serine phosphatase